MKSLLIPNAQQDPKDAWRQAQSILENEQLTDELKVNSLMFLLKDQTEETKRLEIADLLYGFSVTRELGIELRYLISREVFLVYSHYAIQHQSLVHQRQLENLMTLLHDNAVLRVQIEKVREVFEQVSVQ